MVYGFILKDEETKDQLGQAVLGFPPAGTIGKDMYFKINDIYYLVTSIVYFTDRENSKISIGTTTIIGELFLREYNNNNQIQINS